MKKIKLFLLFCILCVSISCGQQKKYVQYSVKEGETMRSIAKTLDVKTRDLLRLNPDVGRRPAPNTIIIIPNTGKISVEETMIDTPEKIDISQITLEEHLQQIKDSTLTALQSEFLVHVVQPKETIYSLKRFYNVTETNLFELNPELSEGLKVDQFLKIRPIVEGETIAVSRYIDVFNEGDSIKIGMLLPFRSMELDTVLSDEIFQNSRLANYVTDMYLGAEIALDSLRKKGINIQLNVFDTERPGTKIAEILAENNLNENDALIGPLYSEEAKFVADSVNIPVIFPVFSERQKEFTAINLIKTSPDKELFRDKLIELIKNQYSNGSLIVIGDQSTAIDNQNIKKELESYDSIFKKRNSLLIASDSIYRKNDSIYKSYSALFQENDSLFAGYNTVPRISDSITKVHILKPENGYIDRSRILNILKPNLKNWVVLATNDEVIVADAINSLNNLPDSISFPTKVFTFNKERTYNAIDNFKLAKIGLTYISNRYVDENDVNTQVFNQHYFAKNEVMPSFYATKGFDIVYDIVMRLASGKDLKSTFLEGASFRVENKFDYYENTKGIIENRGLFIVRYNKNLTLTRMK